MTTYPLNISASTITRMHPYGDAYQEEILISLECSDIKQLFENVTADGLQQELFKHLKKNFDPEFLKEALCI